MRNTALTLFSALALVGCGAYDPNAAVGESQQGVANNDTIPTGRGVIKQAAKPSGGGTSGNGIYYHGGPLILGTPNVYFIWYGSWSSNTATSILPSFVTNLSGSSYEHINTTYYDGSSTHASGTFTMSTQVSVGEYLGAALSDAQILQIVNDSINNSSANGFSAALPYDANAIYFVLTSADVNESSGFCTQYCGWHTHGNVNQGKVRYSFVGNPDRCPSACEAQTTSPNGNAGADGMASIIAHESEEAISDPDGNAWYDRRGYENADKCAWTFGTESTASNGSKYNVVLGGAEYLIQQNWVNASGGYCAMSY